MTPTLWDALARQIRRQSTMRALFWALFGIAVHLGHGAIPRPRGGRRGGGMLVGGSAALSDCARATRDHPCRCADA